jgi:ABC-2 type transport system ATP-binding protein
MTSISISPLNVNKVSKAFGSQRVLDDVSFSLQSDEIFGLIGLNGVGKTTLIKIILNLLKSDEGTCKIFGVDSGEVKAHESLLYLPEKFQPSKYLTGLEYLDMSLSYYKKPMDIKKADSLAERLDLDPAKLRFRVGAYSKGMGQKLGLLSAFMVDVPLLILDEPMSGLDPSARIKLKSLLIDYRNKGKTIFFSSHILSDIDEICNRIGIIHSSKLQFIGTPASFKQEFSGNSLEHCFLGALSKYNAA